MSIFTSLTQTNEFDQKPGTLENPLCLTNHQVCGAVDTTAAYSLVPQVVCCGGLACKCASGSTCSCV